jgi:formylmethanofuran dehydrogenase subunit E
MRQRSRSTWCHAKQKDIQGHTSRTCKECKAFYARNWRQTKRGKEYNKARDEKLKYTNQYKAKMEVYKAVRSGKLPKAKTLKCHVCGEQAYAYEHRDYDKPLEVKPICRKCNEHLGKAKNNYIIKKD